MFAQGIGLTDVGKSREQNEDSLLVDNELELYVVSDGMGGHAAGEIASATAIASVLRSIREKQPVIDRVKNRKAELGDLRAVAERAAQTACRDVFHLASTTPGTAGMGATLTLLLVVDRMAVMAHVGDSRLYLCRGGAVHQMSNDHTMAAELARSGIIRADEIKTHTYANVLTRSIGTREAVPVDTLVLDLLPGDRFLICSDGLAGYIEDLDWLGERLSADDLDGIPDELVGFANAAGGQDNITAVVVRIESDETEPVVVRARTNEIRSTLASLEAVFLFEDLSLAHLTRVLNACDVEVFEPGAVVRREGQTCAELIAVIDGSLCVSRGEKELGRLGPGDFIGATTLIDARAARATIEAAERSRVLRLDRQTFWALLQARPWLGLSLLERLTRWATRDRERLVSKLDRGDGLPAGLTASELF